MNVLIGCEESAEIRDQFIARGHNAMSCDLKPSQKPGPHHQGDILEFLARRGQRWDLFIAHPPCTYLTVSANRWLRDKKYPWRAIHREKAAAFFMKMVLAPIPMICVENPIGYMSTKYREPDQIIQPWQFGHAEMKATCFWLKNLPPLKHTDYVEDPKPICHQMAPSDERAALRARTLPGIAKAMAEQWGNLVLIN